MAKTVRELQEVLGQAAKDGHISLKIYNVSGQEVATVVNKKQRAGNYKIHYDTSELPCGVYFYRLESGNEAFTRKMTLLT